MGRAAAGLLTLAAQPVLRAAPPGEALAQAKQPFNVGISEGGGVPGNALTAWIMSQQIAFEQMCREQCEPSRPMAALWALLGIAFAYGVFHAAGPAHGKAIVASYMLANERALTWPGDLVPGGGLAGNRGDYDCRASGDSAACDGSTDDVGGEPGGNRQLPWRRAAGCVAGLAQGQGVLRPSG